MKKLISLITILTITFTALVPSFSATTAPKTVTIKQYVSTLLTTLQIPYTDPIQEAINQKWVVKEHKLISNINAPITKEQSAQFLYGYLRTKEGVKPDLYYERVLSYYVGDSKNIDPSYKRAVYSTIVNGFYEPQLVKNITKYFNPKNKVTEAEMKLMMARVLDKSKRYDSFQKSKSTGLVDRAKSWGHAPGVDGVVPNVVYPKVASVKKTMAFENGLPVQNKDLVINDLLQEEHNKYDMAFTRYMLYDEYINFIPPSYQDFLTLEQSKALRLKDIQQWYNSSLKFVESYYNGNYNNLEYVEKTIKETMPSHSHSYNLIENHKMMISKNKMKIQSYFVSDEKAFYSFPGMTYIRGRLYFKIESPNKLVPFVTDSKHYSDMMVNVKSGIWYYTDLDVRVVISANNSDEKWSWDGNKDGVADYYVVSDIYEITIKK